MMKAYTFNTSMITISVLIALQSNSWVPIWMLMEINMMGMMLQLMEEKKKEKTVLFLVFQSLPAASMIAYLVVNGSSTDLGMNPQIMMIILISMVCKIGLFPLQNWILKLSKSISWLNNIILMTWQKVLPLIVLMKISWSTTTMAIAVLSMAIMSITMLNMANLKCFIMSSSLIHMGWMMMSMASYYWVSLGYMGVYTLLTLMVVASMKKKSKKMISDQMGGAMNSMKINMMSLAGIPPMAGFLVKVMVLTTLTVKMEGGKTVMVLLLVATASFYAYMQIIYSSMMLMSSKEKFSKKNKINHQKKFLSANSTTTATYYTY